MDCKEIRETLAAWALGDLPEAPAAEVATHLESCAACRREAESLRRALEGVRALPAPPSDPSRRAALLLAAEAEGLFPARSLALRWGLPAAALAAAAAAVLLVAVPGWLAPPVPPSHGVVAGVQPAETPPLRAAVAMFVDGRGASVIREGKSEPRPLQRKDALFRGDRILVEFGEGNKALLRFHPDALDLDVLAGAGEAEIRLEGSSEEAYRIHLDRGSISGRFTQPIEILSSRTKGARFIPLTIASPVGQAEVWKGRTFHVFQGKTALPGDWFETNRMLDAVSMHFRDADLLRLASGPFADVLPGLQFDPALLRGKRISLLCNSIPRARFAEALSDALGPLHLEAAVRDGRHVLLPRAGNPVPAAAGGDDPAYGEFLVEIESAEGEARISSRDPKRPEIVVVAGGRKGVVRPGAGPLSPVPAPASEGTILEPGLELLGTMAAGGGAVMAVVRLDEDGAPASRAVRPGDEVAGYRCERVGWDHLLLAKGGKEYRLLKK